jgi:hypothetical protein
MSEKTYCVKDSGRREETATGAVRDSRDGKGRYDLISPLAIRRIAVHLEKGARKYTARNWEKGFSFTRMLDSAFRHLYQYQEGARDEDHLAAVCFNVMAIMHFEEMIQRGIMDTALNDTPSYVKEPPDGRTEEGDGCGTVRLVVEGHSQS